MLRDDLNDKSTEMCACKSTDDQYRSVSINYCVFKDIRNDEYMCVALQVQICCFQGMASTLSAQSAKNLDVFQLIVDSR